MAAHVLATQAEPRSRRTKPQSKKILILKRAMKKSCARSSCKALSTNEALVLESLPGEEGVVGVQV